MPSPRIVHVNLSDRIFERLKESITRWEFRPGERLIDADIAESYGVSRSLVRNAITLLVNEGLVEVCRRRFYVARYSQKDIRDVLELRRLLELSAIEAAIRDTTGDEFGALEVKMAEAENHLAAGRLETFYALDVETHRLIIEKGDNDYIKRIYATLQTILRIVIRSDFDKRAKISQAFGEHQILLKAWKRGDVNAAREALAHHLDGAEERVMENFALSGGEQGADAGASGPISFRERRT